MISSWREEWLRNFYEHDIYSKKIPADLRDRLFRKLQMIEDAETETDLRVPLSNHFEHLRGHLAGWCSIRVNLQWRLIFQWTKDKAHDIYLDNHTYR